LACHRRCSGRGPERRRDGAHSDELVDRYQQVATHLSVIRTAAPDGDLVAHLSSLLSRARIAMLGARVLNWRAGGRFFAEQFLPRVESELKIAQTVNLGVMEVPEEAF
jgi:hypothetical protein